MIGAKELVQSLFDWTPQETFWLPGASLRELLAYVEHDYDDVDRLYVEFETIGGG